MIKIEIFSVNLKQCQLFFKTILLLQNYFKTQFMRSSILKFELGLAWT